MRFSADLSRAHGHRGLPCLRASGHAISRLLGDKTQNCLSPARLRFSNTICLDLARFSNIVWANPARFSNTISDNLTRFSNFIENNPYQVRPTICLSGSAGGRGQRFPLPVLRVGGAHMLYRLIRKVFASFQVQMMQIQVK